MHEASEQQQGGLVGADEQDFSISWRMCTTGEPFTDLTKW